MEYCKMKYLLLIILLVMNVSLFSQITDFERKSISSVESVWIRPGAISGFRDIPMHFLDEMLTFYIEMPRFDYNQLPNALLEDFRRQANALPSITPQNLATVLNNTVGQKIKEILEDDDIRRSRADDFRADHWKATFAGSRGRSLGLTVDEVERLMNSAYVYLPFISSFELRRDGDEIRTRIRGGIIWYQVVVSPQGDVNMVLRVAAESVGEGFADRNPRVVMGMRADYTRFQWGNTVYRVTEEEYALYAAIQAWARNLQVRTREIEEFNITAQIMERHQGRVYSARIGKREGLHLDDGFFLIEQYETADGEARTRRIGFTRLKRNADNRENPDEMSLFRQYLGRTASPGMFLMEHPRLGIDMRMRFGYQTGMTIPAEYTRFIVARPFFSGVVEILEEDADSQIFFAVDFAYNLAPITGISQFFAEIEGSFGLPMASYNIDARSSSVYTLGAYGGVSKKWWAGRHSFYLSGKVGYDRLVMDGQFLSWNYKYTINAWGVKSDVAYNFLVTPDFHLNLGVGHKLGLPPTGVSFEFNNETIIDYNSTLVARTYPDLRLGGTTFNVGFTYSFGELPFNIFGWLDPLRKH